MKNKQTQIDLLTQELANTTKQRDTALQISNFLIQEIFTIESTIEQSSFKGNPKRPLIFIIKNYKEVIKIIELVIESYKKVRESLKPYIQNKNEDTGSTELPSREL